MGANLIFGFFRALLALSGLAAILIGAAIITAGPAVKAGLVDYTKVFQFFGAATAPLLAVTLVSLLGGVFAVINGPRRIGAFSLIAAVIGAAGAYGPISMKSAVDKYPFIHDITTDFAEPPQIVAGAGEKRDNPAEYVGDEPAFNGDGKTVAEAQQEAYASLAPLEVASDLETTAQLVRKAIAAMDMAIIGDGPIAAQSPVAQMPVSDPQTEPALAEPLAEGASEEEPALEEGGGEDIPSQEGAPAASDMVAAALPAWRIEAVATSSWFGFKDDFVVRLQSTEEGGTVINVRSKSRVGLSDLGVNAARIEEFFALIKAS